MNDKYLNWIGYVFFVLLLVFLPTQFFWTEVLAFRTGWSEEAIFWLTHGYEIALPLIVIMAIYVFVKQRPKSIDLSVFVAMALVFLSFTTVVLSDNHGLALESYRFSFLSVTLFIILYVFSASFNDKQQKNLVKLYLIIAIIIALIAVVERLLPPFYWVKLGLISPDSGFGYGPRLAGRFIQSASIIGGPNQLASYLLPAVYILLLDKKKLNISLPFAVYPFLVGITILAIFLTASRSAIVGLVVGLVLLVFFYIKGYLVKILSLLMVLVIGGLFLLGSGSDNEAIRDFVNHGTSQKLHYEALQNFKTDLNTWSVTDKLIGRGAGLSGPVALKYGHGSIPESWYLQLIIEFGFLGLTLWVVFIAFLIWRMVQIGDKGLLFGLIAVSVTAIFLHTWADNPALSYTLMVLIGANLRHKTKKTI